MYAVNHYEWIVTQLAAAKAGLILGKDDKNHKKLFSDDYQVHFSLFVNRFNSHITVVNLNDILLEFV